MNLEEVRRLLDAARTDEPWRTWNDNARDWDNYGDPEDDDEDEPSWMVGIPTGWHDGNPKPWRFRPVAREVYGPDAALIALAPELASEVLRLTARIAELESEA